MELIKKSIADKEEVKQFFFDVFTKEPWNDDWSIAQQLDRDVPAYDFYRKHGFEEHKSNVAFAKNL